jgi:CRP/FNR family transcriptional regulator, cyclic AMP receptor protein
MANGFTPIVPTDFLLAKGPGKTIETHGDKEIIYSQGAPADAVFYLQSGIVKLTMSSKGRRRKAVLAILQDGDLFGDGCLSGESVRLSTATSIGRSVVTRIDRAVFLRKIDRDAAFAAILVKYLVSRTDRFQADLADLFLNTSEKRLARILLMYGSFAQEPKKGSAAPAFNQSALAEMVGTTRARVSTFMNEFRKRGFVRYNGELEINTERLTRFLEG